MTITYHNEYGSYNVYGVNPVYQDIFNLKIENGGGRFMNDLDLKNQNKVIVIDRKIEEVLFKTESALGKYVQVGKVMFKVVGINSKKNVMVKVPLIFLLRQHNPSSTRIKSFTALPCRLMDSKLRMPTTNSTTN